MFSIVNILFLMVKMNDYETFCYCDSNGNHREITIDEIYFIFLTNPPS